MYHFLPLLFISCLTNPHKVLEVIDWVSPTGWSENVQVAQYGVIRMIKKMEFH